MQICLGFMVKVFWSCLEFLGYILYFCILFYLLIEFLISRVVKFCSKNVYALVFTLICIFLMFFFIYLIYISSSVILLEGGDGSGSRSLTVYTNSRPSSPISSNFGIDNESLIPNANNQLVLWNPNQYVISIGNRNWEPYFGLYRELAQDTAYYSTRNSSNQWNAEFHATRLFNCILDIKELLRDTKIILQFSMASPINLIDITRDLVSQLDGVTIIIKFASTVEQSLQQEILEAVKQAVFHMQEGYKSVVQGDIDYADAVYSSSPNTEKSFTNSIGEKEYPITDLQDFEDAKSALDEASGILLQNNWNQDD